MIQRKGMFETSQDILYVVISFCVLWATVFLCWMLYYVVRILKNANQIIEEFRVRLQTLSEAISYIRGKVEHMSGLLSMVTEGAGGLAKRFIQKKTNAWMDRGAASVSKAAKEAVDKAVDETSRKMKKAA